MEGLTYAWYDSDDSLIAEGTDTLTLENVTCEGIYSCWVTDPYGSEAAVVFDVALENDLYAYALDADGDETEELMLEVLPGQQATLQVYASATDPNGITFSWSRFDVSLVSLSVS